MIDISIIPTQMRILGGAEFRPHSGIFLYAAHDGAWNCPSRHHARIDTHFNSWIRGEVAMNMAPSMDPGWEWGHRPAAGHHAPLEDGAGKRGKMLAAGLKIATTDGILLAINALFALILPGPS